MWTYCCCDESISLVEVVNSKCVSIVDVVLLLFLIFVCDRIDYFRFGVWTYVGIGNSEGA